jgi:hypothetical protein
MTKATVSLSSFFRSTARAFLAMLLMLTWSGSDRALAFVPLSQAPPPPMTELKAAYPYAEQQALEVTPDNTRAFVAEGAAIAVLDLTTGTATPTVLAQVEIPNASPKSLLYYRHSGTGQRYLFVAGGTMGLWQISFCENLFTQPPPVPPACLCLNGAKECALRIDQDNQIANQRKRCVDMAIVEGNVSAGVPLLCALFSARGDTPLPLGPTELQVYKLNTDGTATLYGNGTPSHPLQIIAGTIAPQNRNAVGSAIVSDPGDPTSVYVAMGTGWLYRIDLSTSTFTYALYPGPTTGLPSGCPWPPCPEGEQMRDLALVRTATQKAVIYASLDYGRVLEYRNVGTLSPTVTALPVPQSGGRFPNRIAAVTGDAASGQGDRVLIALGLESFPGTTTDTEPASLTGGWSDICTNPGIVDPNQPTLPCGVTAPGCNEIRFYKSNIGTTPPALTQVGGSFSKGLFWRSLLLRRSATVPCLFWSLECTVYDGTVGRTVGDPFAFGNCPSPPPNYTHIGPSFSATDGTVSILNSKVTYFGSDAGPAIQPKAMMYITSSPRDIVPVEDAALCPAPFNPCQPQPNPYTCASLMGAANWADPDGANEWFVQGGQTYHLVDQNCNAPVPYEECVANPCGVTNPPYYWKRNSGPPAPTDVGWFLVSMKTGTIGSTSPPSISNAVMKWWQLDSLVNSSEKAEFVTYLSSQRDPRSQPVHLQVPKYIHCLRGGSDRGLKIYKTADLTASASGTCNGLGRGQGEHITPALAREALTHVELETPLMGQACIVNVPCSPGHEIAPRNLWNNRTDVFAVTDPSGNQRWVVAVAAGFVATESTGQPAGCLWGIHYGRSMTAFYDVSAAVLDQVPPPTPPPLFPLKIALGPDPSSDPTQRGHAWAVKVKTYTSPSPFAGRSFAFVADLLGRLLVFEVSGSELFPGAISPYLPLINNPTTNKFLPLAGSLTFPTDPSDLMNTNCIDLELDGNYLYCSLGRIGIGIVDVTTPPSPSLSAVIDTPGIAEGLAMRKDEFNHDQLVVGDTRGGMRLYGRPGE